MNNGLRRTIFYHPSGRVVASMHRVSMMKAPTGSISANPFRRTVIFASKSYYSNNMAEKKNIDERLVKWNEIFDELTLDARDLIKDIKDMINYIASFAILMVLIGVAAVLIAVQRQLEPKYLAASIIIFSIMVGNATLLIRKWLRLRIRYDKLSSINRKIDSS